jgi:FkbM family methyltransferase
MAGRRVLGRGHISRCRRCGINWKLDLNEGIDFSIFLLGSFEPEVVSAYQRIIPRGATVIDIGANIGAHTLPFAACVGEHGRVIAIEPTRYAFDRLLEQIAANPDLAPRITPIQAMLLADCGAELAREIPSSWPLRTPVGAHAGHLGVGKSTEGARVATLDNLVSELGVSCHFVKLDVDGYEVEVLRGARLVLAKFCPTIFFEHSPYMFTEKGFNQSEMMAGLRAAGYYFTDLSGRTFSSDGSAVPDVPIGASVNLMAAPRRARPTI